MRGLRVFVAMALGLSLLLLPLFSGFAAEPAKVLKIGNTVAMKTKEGIQIKKWLELFAERRTTRAGSWSRGSGTMSRSSSMMMITVRTQDVLLRRGLFIRTR